MNFVIEKKNGEAGGRSVAGTKQGDQEKRKGKGEIRGNSVGEQSVREL